MRELTCGFGISRAEHSAANERPVSASIDRLQYTLTAHRKRAVVQVTGTGVNGLMIARVDGDCVDRRDRDKGIVVVLVQVVVELQQFVVFQTPPPTLPA